MIMRDKIMCSIRWRASSDEKASVIVEEEEEDKANKWLAQRIDISGLMSRKTEVDLAQSDFTCRSRDNKEQQQVGARRGFRMKSLRSSNQFGPYQWLASLILLSVLLSGTYGEQSNRQQVKNKEQRANQMQQQSTTSRPANSADLLVAIKSVSRFSDQKKAQVKRLKSLPTQQDLQQSNHHHHVDRIQAQSDDSADELVATNEHNQPVHLSQRFANIQKKLSVAQSAKSVELNRADKAGNISAREVESVEAEPLKAGRAFQEATGQQQKSIRDSFDEQQQSPQQTNAEDFSNFDVDPSSKGNTQFKQSARPFQPPFESNYAAQEEAFNEYPGRQAPDLTSVRVQQESHKLAEEQNGLTEGGGFSGVAVEKHRPASIRVVFNNNPHFIIGNGRDQSPLTRKTRQPSSLFDGDYHPDESSLDETKVSIAKKGAQQEAEEPPCKKDLMRPSLANMEKIDLISQEPSVKRPPISKKQHIPPIQADKTEPQQEEQARGDEQVNTPFEQIVKSGLRPPLRMVISMRNKVGDTMKVPVNLRGASPAQETPGQQMELVFEPPAQTIVSTKPNLGQKSVSLDENTPIGGDVFDPSLAMPFGKTSKKSADRKQVKQEELRPQVQQTLEPIEKPQVKEEPQVKQAPGLNQATKRPDCNSQKETASDETDGDDDEQQNQAHVIVGANDGVVQMVVPKLTSFHNATFATMFNDFQKALNDQMAHQQRQQNDPPGKQDEQISQQQDEQVQQNQQKQDEQEDLMVAMMAANMSASQQGRLTMTVIKPPKGTSLNEAIKVHSQQTRDPSQTVAILHSIRTKLMKPGRAQAQSVDVRLRPNPNSVSESLPADPDGFSSSGSESVYSRHRVRRAANSESSPYGGLLEPADRLANAPRKSSPANNEKAKKSKGTDSKDKELIQAAASEHQSSRQNELSSDDDETDEEADASDESQSAPVASESEADAEDSNDLGDDLDDAAAFDADDEPYNQGASSERDYNSPSFEIPKIDINPDSLKQNGCRTVLREVQEIPMNGLGVVQADGQPGSGYEGQTAAASNGNSRLQLARVKRQSSNDNLINSRKVTSIVMTKECHFPNDAPTSNAKPTRPPPISHRVVAPVSLDSMQVSKQSQSQKPSKASYQQVEEYPVQQQQQNAAKPRVNFYSSQNPARNEQIEYQPAMQSNQYVLSTTPIQQRVQVHTLTHPQQHANLMKRRSVAQQTADGSKMAKKEKDFYLSSDSKRNEVVAQKLYKPPSAEDPYHTLSYSSKNGVDPDPDDESDSDKDSDKEPRAPQSAHREAASNRKLLSEVLSEREREALLDPNYDDTDPRPSQPKEQEAEEERPAQESDDVDDADDAMDETRVDRARKQVPHPAHHMNPTRPRPHASPHPQPQPQPARRPPPAMRQAPARRMWSPPSEPQVLERRAPIPQEPAQQRFGKSFKFEHEVARPQPRGLMAQLRQLPAGRQEFVAVEGAARRRQREPASNRKQPVKRRSDRDEDPDERDEGDDDEQPTNNQRKAASARAETESEPPAGEEEDPDADPDYNPKEGHLPAHSKPKKVQKSFAYVHRDLPRKGSKNDDDFVVSYGRGNLQTEQEDYDSDRDNSNNNAPSEDKSQNQAASRQRTRLAPVPASKRAIDRRAQPKQQVQPPDQQYVHQYQPMQQNHQHHRQVYPMPTMRVG